MQWKCRVRLQSQSAPLINDLENTVKVPTCVFVESKVGGGSSRYCFVCNFAILACVWVIGRHSDNGCPRGTLCAQTDSIADWVEGGSVIINVNQIYPHIGY